MVGSLFIWIAGLVLVLFLVLIVMLFDVAFRGDAERRAGACRWHPPFAQGAELFNWARGIAARIVGTRLRGKRTAATPVKLSVELHEAATCAMLPLARETQTRLPVACPEGGQGVFGITAPEVFEITDYIRRNLPRAERKRIHELASENVKQMADLNHTQPNAASTPCPLQGDDGICRVYAARPLHCRPLHAEIIADRLGLTAANSDGATRHCGVHQEMIERGVERGLEDELGSARLDAHVYELNSALATALEAPDAAVRWIEGEDVFAGCRRL